MFQSPGVGPDRKDGRQPSSWEAAILWLLWAGIGRPDCVVAVLVGLVGTVAVLVAYLVSIS